MTDRKEDLWPDDIGAPPEDKPPLVILREQATMLGDKTSNLVEAEVTTMPDVDSSLMLRFTLIAPALSNYRYDLFTANQSASMYPVKLVFEGRAYHADSEEGLKQYLRNVFASHTAKRIIGIRSASRATRTCSRDCRAHEASRRDRQPRPR